MDGRGQITRRVPVGAREPDRASSSLKPSGKLLALLDSVIEPNNVPAVDVAEDLDLAHLDYDGSVLVTTHRHARLEEDVRPRLLTSGEPGLSPSFHDRRTKRLP